MAYSSFQENIIRQNLFEPIERGKKCATIGARIEKGGLVNFEVTLQQVFQYLTHLQDT